MLPNGFFVAAAGIKKNPVAAAAGCDKNRRVFAFYITAGAAASQWAPNPAQLAAAATGLESAWQLQVIPDGEAGFSLVKGIEVQPWCAAL